MINYILDLYKDPHNNCQPITAIVQAACYCPYDFIGSTCNTQLSISCQMNKEYPLSKCTSANSQYYVYDINGDPPCNNYYPTDNAYLRYLINYKALNKFLRMNINCSNYDPIWSYEGIKINTTFIADNIPRNSPNYSFKYSHSSPQVIM